MIGSGITVRGQNGTVGYSAVYGGPQDISVFNQGTISADVSGGTITVNAQPFSNQGLAQSDQRRDARARRRVEQQRDTGGEWWRRSIWQAVSQVADVRHFEPDQRRRLMSAGTLTNTGTLMLERGDRLVGAEWRDHPGWQRHNHRRGVLHCRTGLSAGRWTG